MAHDVDIAVVGGGPAGAALARKLAGRGLAVMLLERTQFGNPRVGESLSPAVQPLLAELGVWDEFLAIGPLPSHGTRSVWGSEDVNEHSHVVSPYGCGWHVERVAFDRMLVDAAVASGAELRCGAAVIGCELSDDGWWSIPFDDAREKRSSLRASVLVDATGRFAHVARRLGTERITFDRLVGVATLFADVDVTNEGYVLVETTHDGWWYSAPVPPNGLMVMLMTDSDLWAGRTPPSERWRTALTRAATTSQRISGAPRWGPRVFSAQSHRLRRTESSAPWIAVGDAALAVDPMSGSGVVRALRSAKAAAETASGILDGRTASAIAAYEADRDDACTDYLYERLSYYATEERWTDSPFWMRRTRVAAAMSR